MTPKTTEACLVAVLRMLLDAEIETAALRLLLTQRCEIDQQDLDQARDLAAASSGIVSARLRKLEGPIPLTLADILQRLEGMQ